MSFTGRKRASPVLPYPINPARDETVLELVGRGLADKGRRRPQGQLLEERQFLKAAILHYLVLRSPLRRRYPALPSRVLALKKT